jgi:hypothetical protein
LAFCLETKKAEDGPERLPPAERHSVLLGDFEILDPSATVRTNPLCGKVRKFGSSGDAVIRIA